MGYSLCTPLFKDESYKEKEEITFEEESEVVLVGLLALLFICTLIQLVLFHLFDDYLDVLERYALIVAAYYQLEKIMTKNLLNK